MLEPYAVKVASTVLRGVGDSDIAILPDNVTLIGRLTRDPELRYLKGEGTPVANFSIAIDREYSNKKGKKEADFIKVEVWNKIAESCTNHIGKGSLVGIQGSIRTEKYETDQGEKKTTTKVRANTIKFLDSKYKQNSGAYHQGDAPLANPISDVIEEELPF